MKSALDQLQFGRIDNPPMDIDVDGLRDRKENAAKAIKAFAKAMAEEAKALPTEEKLLLALNLDLDEKSFFQLCGLGQTEKAFEFQQTSLLNAIFSDQSDLEEFDFDEAVALAPRLGTELSIDLLDDIYGLSDEYDLHIQIVAGPSSARKMH